MAVPDKKSPQYKGGFLKPRVLVLDETSKKARGKIKKIAESALKDLGLDGREVSLLLTDDRGIKELNRKFRNINKPTDVLSFPMEDPVLLGDIAISMETAERQAKVFNATLVEELGRLVIHGILHLLGYDHVKGGVQAKKMRSKEEELLSKLRAKDCIQG